MPPDNNPQVQNLRSRNPSEKHNLHPTLTSLFSTNLFTQFLRIGTRCIYKGAILILNDCLPTRRMLSGGILLSPFTF